MKKLAFFVVMAASFMTACTATTMQSDAGSGSTYVIDGYGHPVKYSGGCVTSNSPNSKSYPECEGGMAGDPKPMMQKPEVVTKVIVDCNLCNGNKPK
ncbi:MAG: hypothetical protein R3F02_07580 [Thiolinea sp.]